MSDNEAIIKDIEDVIQWVKAQPEIIRCKDCKHWGGADKNGFGACMQWHLYGVYDGDWFCADAEKKEGAENGR